MPNEVAKHRNNANDVAKNKNENKVAKHKNNANESAKHKNNDRRQ